jgi:hypothetical protein
MVDHLVVYGQDLPNPMSPLLLDTIHKKAMPYTWALGRPMSGLGEAHCRMAEAGNSSHPFFLDILLIA